MHPAQRDERQACYYRRTRYRRCLTRHHAHRLAPHAYQCGQYVRFSTHPLESGAVVKFSLTVIPPNFTNLCFQGSYLAPARHCR